MAVHWGCHDIALTAPEVSNFSSGTSGCKSKGAKDVHDQVDPNEHHSVEGGVSDRAVADDDGDKTRKVASNLELEEALDVHLNVAAPPDGLDAGIKVVGLEDHGSLVSCVGGTTLKSKGHIGGFKGFNIVDTFTNTGDLLGSFLGASPYDLFAIFVLMLSFTDLVFFSCIQALKSSDETEFILRFGASNDFEVANDLVECLLVGERVQSFSFLTLLDFSLGADDITDDLSEPNCVHGDIVEFIGRSVVLITVKDTAVISDSN